MKKIAFVGALLVLMSTSLLAQPSITIVAGKKDTVYNARHFFRGLTDPEATVSVNGKSFPVYHTGAFAAEVTLNVGYNDVVLSSRKGFEETIDVLRILYQLPPKPVTTSIFVIEEAGIIPQGLSMVSPGDIVKVRVKALPECTVTWLNGNKLQELSPLQADGLGGIYQGQYVVKENDSLLSMPIEVVLTSKGRSLRKKVSDGLMVAKTAEPLLVRTVGDNTYLNYGLGQDRLGGSKIGFIDKNILLHVVGKVNDLYKVQLAQNFHAWIPQSQTELVPAGSFKPESLTSSWMLRGDDKYDYLSIGLTCKLPYRSFQEINPARIVVDIYGALSNTTWITQLQSAKEVKNVNYEQLESDVFRVTIELNHRQHWGYSVRYEGNNLVVKIKHRPKLMLKGMLIALDAGHGGEASGAVGTTGLKEKDVNLAMVYMLKTELEKRGARVILTRSGDFDLSMNDRLSILKEYEPDILISIHGNAGGNPFTAKGTSTYYRHIGYKPLTVSILNQLLDLGMDDFGNIGSFNFLLCAPTECPSVLVETLFLSSPSDEARLVVKDFQQSMVRKIVDGLNDFIKKSN